MPRWTSDHIPRRYRFDLDLQDMVRKGEHFGDWVTVHRFPRSHGPIQQRYLRRYSKRLVDEGTLLVSPNDHLFALPRERVLRMVLTEDLVENFGGTGGGVSLREDRAKHLLELLDSGIDLSAVPKHKVVAARAFCRAPHGDAFLVTGLARALTQMVGGDMAREVVELLAPRHTHSVALLSSAVDTARLADAEGVEVLVLARLMAGMDQFTGTDDALLRSACAAIH